MNIEILSRVIALNKEDSSLHDPPSEAAALEG
jgi:hypothetical protein